MEEMQVLFERIKIPSELVESYIEQSVGLSIDFLATLNENNLTEQEIMVKLGFSHIAAYRMIVVSKQIKGN